MFEVLKWLTAQEITEKNNGGDKPKINCLMEPSRSLKFLLYKIEAKIKIDPQIPIAGCIEQPVISQKMYILLFASMAYDHAIIRGPIEHQVGYGIKN